MNKLLSIKYHKAILENFLCSKESNGEIQEHKLFLSKMNTSITVANTTLAAASLTANLPMARVAKKLKRMSQMLQDKTHISFLNNIRSLYSRGCLFSPSIAKTYFVTRSIFKLKRNLLGLVEKRKKEWSYHSVRKNNVLRTQFQKNVVKTRSLIY
jgi:hypothetical protein